MNGEPRDVVRQIGVIAAACFMLIAAMVGTGLFGGTPVQDLQDGALDADGSYLAPATQAFSIWSVIYLGLIAYTVWQALPGQRTDERQRALGPWIAATMVLNGLWLVTAQFLTLPLTVLMIVVLLIALALTFRRAVVVAPPRGWVGRILIDGVTGLHLGWVTLATVANTTAWLTQIGDPSWADAADLWGVAVLAVVAVIGVSIAAVSGRLAPTLALTWGLSWLAVGRLADEPPSAVIGATAIVVALVILVAGVVFWLRSTREGRSGKGRIGARTAVGAPAAR
ncbi:TspO/MBR family protein [Microbacterium sp. Marseille-Q6648]|uniref:TspO/MBR family protein n=1 Tax=Microbacterium sp. Marseille-Q6648 TaxID=2937991 RepID=UPI00203AD5EB|nr:TspO/MBR family protein [Microbacterium sp. Marseille-Q6648]